MAIITQVSKTAVFLLHFAVKWGVGAVHRCADVSAHFEVYYNALHTMHYSGVSENAVLVHNAI